MSLGQGGWLSPALGSSSPPPLVSARESPNQHSLGCHIHPPLLPCQGCLCLHGSDQEPHWCPLHSSERGMGKLVLAT